MTPRPPSLAALRDRELRGPDAQSGNWLARRFARPMAIYGTWLAVRLGISAHQVTAAAMVVSIASALAIGNGSRSGFVIGAGLGLLAFWLDRVDGQVARWRGTVSLAGVYLDYLMHHAATLSLGFGLGYGLASRTGRLPWAAAGFAVGAAWTFLNLHNDCRYKAFFQPLKRASDSFRVIGGAQERSGPSPPRQRSVRALLTDPAYMICEPHAALVAVLTLAAMAAVSPSWWVISWAAYVGSMAILAPVLAAGRIARAVVRRSVDEEFDRWFQPIESFTQSREAPERSRDRRNDHPSAR